MTATWNTDLQYRCQEYLNLQSRLAVKGPVGPVSHRFIGSVCESHHLKSWCIGGKSLSQPNRGESFLEDTGLTEHFTSVTTKQSSTRVSLFFYPVFFVEPRSFLIEFNRCFVLPQEKSADRINKNNSSLFTACWIDNLTIQQRWKRSLGWMNCSLQYWNSSGHHRPVFWLYISASCVSGVNGEGPKHRRRDSQRSGHLLEIVSAAGIKDGTALKQLQGLLDIALETQD